MSSTRTFERRLLPRWLNSQSASYVGLSGSAEIPLASDRSQFQHIAAEREWIRDGSLFSAIDLVSSSLIYSDWDNFHSKSAAKYILDSDISSSSARELAQCYLNGATFCLAYGGDETNEEIKALIARLRNSVRSTPIDPISWLDLAYCYAFTGNSFRSIRAMKAAVSLAPHSILIARSAARAFSHYGLVDDAVSVLRRAYSSTGKLEFMISEAAISMQYGASSRAQSSLMKIYKREGVQGVGLGLRAELGALIATVESFSGAHKRSRKIASSVQRYVSDENVLAQMEWLSKEERFDLEYRPELPADFEADAIAAYTKGRYREAVNACSSWLRYQPFSAAPSVHGSYIASVALADFSMAEMLSKIGYLFSSDEFMAVNNYAFSLAANGDPVSATNVLSSLTLDGIDKKDRNTLLATSAFIAYKLGNIDEGRQLYSKALSQFERDKSRKSFAIAAHFWSMVDPSVRDRGILDKALAIAKGENMQELLFYYKSN